MNSKREFPARSIPWYAKGIPSPFKPWIRLASPLNAQSLDMQSESPTSSIPKSAKWIPYPVPLKQCIHHTSPLFPQSLNPPHESPNPSIRHISPLPSQVLNPPRESPEPSIPEYATPVLCSLNPWIRHVSRLNPAPSIPESTMWVDWSLNSWIHHASPLPHQSLNPPNESLSIIVSIALVPCLLHPPHESPTLAILESATRVPCPSIPESAMRVSCPLNPSRESLIPWIRHVSPLTSQSLSPPRESLASSTPESATRFPCPLDLWIHRMSLLSLQFLKNPPHKSPSHLNLWIRHQISIITTIVQSHSIWMCITLWIGSQADC